MIQNFELTEEEKLIAFYVLYPQIISECRKREANPVMVGNTWTEHCTRYRDSIVLWYGFEKNGYVDTAIIHGKVVDINAAYNAMMKPEQLEVIG